MRLLMMKSFMLVFFLLLAGKAHSSAPDPFITIWQTDGNKQIVIPLMGDGYDFRVEWGDGTIYDYQGSSSEISEITHQYTVSDTYTVIIRPYSFSGFPRIYLNNFNNSNLLLEIKQWGGGEWSSMNQAFSGASNLKITATDVPDLSEVTDLSYMFFNASSVNSDFIDWDVSGVTKMNNTFDNASSFNGNLSDWNVSEVTDMSYMFTNANAFNSDISNWNISHVTNATGMFYGAHSFNATLNTWNVSAITEMSNMFTNATSFNSDLSEWNVSNITNMESIFNNASSFNGELSNWNVSNVTNMNNMFNNASSFNGDISNWDVSNVNNVNGMFNGALRFNARLNNWNVSNISDMSYMFSNASSFNSNLSDWNVSNVTNMSDMFSHASSFNRDLSNWNVSGVTNMSNMFNNASTFNGALGSWNVSNVTNMSDMFSNASVFNKDLSSWNVSNVIYINSMFSNALMFDQDLSAWNISNVTFASNFLINAKLSTTNYDALLIGWSNVANQIPSSLDINFGKSKYSDNTAVIAAKTYLTETKSWTINDGGKYAPPTINSMVLMLNNNTVQVTFSERVYSDINGTSDLEASDFSFAIAGGSATLTAVTPVIISTTDNISFILGIGLSGKTDGAETLTVSPVADAIYNLAGDVAIITQSNNTALLYEPLVTKNGLIGTTDSSYVDKNGKTGSGTGLNPSGKSIVTRSTDD